MEVGTLSRADILFVTVGVPVKRFCGNKRSLTVRCQLLQYNIMSSGSPAYGITQQLGNTFTMSTTEQEFSNQERQGHLELSV